MSRHRRALPRPSWPARRLAITILALAYALIAGPTASAADEAVLWQALRTGGHVAIMRHALAPGTGDPRAFALRDCTSQRNLSEEGRVQAARIGDRFRANGVASARVHSSQWCRCLDTARLLELGPVGELTALNSFFERRERGAPQTRALKVWLAAQPAGPALVLVTHQVNVTALTGVYPTSGEIVVIQRSPNGGIAVLGTIKPDAY